MSGYLLPQACAVCLGAPDRVLAYEQRERYGSEVVVSKLEVPMCGACLARATRLRRRAWVLLALWAGGGVIAAAAVWATTGAPSAAWLAAIGVTCGTTAFVLGSWKAAVCGVEGGLPYFENPAYQRLFEESNGLDESAYSAEARQYLRMRQAEAASGGGEGAPATDGGPKRLTPPGR